MTTEVKMLVQWLVDQRKSLGMTQAQLSQKLGLNKVSLNKLENLQRRIDICEFCDLCQTLGVDPSDAVRSIMLKNDLNEARG